MEVEWIHFETVDSTNAWVKKHVDSLDPSKLTCVTADIQTAGYGTRGKSWVSEKGNLHMTLFFLLPLGDPILPNLGQILSFACLKALPKSVQIKWPNDLVYNGKKLCGVLVEAISNKGKTGIIMGLGMNVKVPPTTDQETTSLIEITKDSYDLQQLSQVIVHQFQVALKQGFASIKDEYASRLAFVHKRVSFFVGEKKIEGTMLGLDKQGRLQIETDDKQILIFSSGEIHFLRCL